MIDSIREIEQDIISSYGAVEDVFGVNNPTILAEHLEKLSRHLGAVPALIYEAELGYLKDMDSWFDSYAGVKLDARLRTKQAECACHNTAAMKSRVESLDRNLRTRISALQTEINVFEKRF